MWNILRSGEMKRCLVDRDGVEPHDMPIIVGELSVVMVVARMVRFEMLMHRSVRVIGVRFVHVLGRKRRCKRDVRHKNDTDDGPPE
jgi:hypothetical protein